MLRIVDAEAEVPDDPTPGPMLTITIEISGTSLPTFTIKMEVEELNHCTRRHNGRNSDLTVCHMMCERATRDQQFAVLQEIADDPSGFYGQLYDWNERRHRPLNLFRDTGIIPHVWPPVKHTMDDAVARIAAVERLAAVVTPCYALIVSKDPDPSSGGALLDASLTAVVHP
jgi:hypothetical protein